ncbi:class I SAM-dependent methyltransferase [Romboutsia lituseburensis]|uniref:Methyltransferase domain-containing protein n=1 Tax=Romboutsia lituseburensis DSM 797 TaxID=1121325 RepID=A0A1G9MQS6_9FIRM|nr:class I SAM-dependent methyltransferase [Romboutsia lituseburensis]CEH34354.1 Methyltransferase type 11 [Romboutsia lituseburensis]SDL76636.1 Methyltransferase domain-containing protein [Romboutsia lituseburensis DSM 797]
MDIRKHNEIAWDNEVKIGNKWTIPVSSVDVDMAKKGNYTILLTPTKPVPNNWIGDVAGKDLLCLASGGGQQGPIFSALGANVTVFDNSKEQLSKDEMVANRDNLNIKLQQGDMRDLSRFDNETFDFIFHPVSNCFIDNIETVWSQCYRVLRPGGVLIAGFSNPISYIFDLYEWEKNNKLIVRNSIPYSDIEQLPKDQLEERIQTKDTLEFGHSLQSQIGGQIDAGFVISGFYEDKLGDGLLDKHIDTFIATKATKL